MAEAVRIHSRNAAGRRSRLPSAAPRWGALAAGSALAIFGLTRRSKAGLALAAGGGLLAVAGSRLNVSPAQSVARSTIQVNCSPQQAFEFWRNLENLPTFMHHLDSVSILGERRSRWVAGGPMGSRIHWEAEIVAERPGELISWRSLPGSDIDVDGYVEFREAPGKRGAFVSANIIYSPPAGKLGGAVARLLGKDPGFMMRQDLRRFKALIEAGEIPTVEGQSHGPRSRVVAAARALDPDQSIRRDAGMRAVLEGKGGWHEGCLLDGH
ncbi:MAG TPA: SRPBCC family protein [Candidatus Angelobacter sp.]|nr:SRPBCC family protein [Candidatus Angelobacter sp.]